MPSNEAMPNNKMTYPDWLYDLNLKAHRENSSHLVGKDHDHWDSYTDGLTPQQEFDRLVKVNHIKK